MAALNGASEVSNGCTDINHNDLDTLKLNRKISDRRLRTEVDRTDVLPILARNVCQSKSRDLNVTAKLKCPPLLQSRNVPLAASG